jgi:hypothetical protein
MTSGTVRNLKIVFFLKNTTSGDMPLYPVEINMCFSRGGRNPDVIQRSQRKMTSRTVRKSKNRLVDEKHHNKWRDEKHHKWRAFVSCDGGRGTLRSYNEVSNKNDVTDGQKILK